MEQPVEKVRLSASANNTNWKKWGPYLTERQWGTVREDYSPDGAAWENVTHDEARSKAYRWGEEGIGGISDYKQKLCLAWAFWNGKDPFIKERLFRLVFLDLDFHFFFEQVEDLLAMSREDSRELLRPHRVVTVNMARAAVPQPSSRCPT